MAGMSSVAPNVFERPGERLEAAAREHYAHDGYVAFSQLIEPEQVEALRAHGCTNVQGYLFSKPVPAAEVIPLLKANAKPRAA